MIARVYLSGKISGRPEAEWREQFDRAERHYISGGFEVVNPRRIADSLPKNTTYEEYMKADLKALKTCTHISMLAGWETSKGANRELKEAQKLGLEVLNLKYFEKK